MLNSCMVTNTEQEIFIQSIRETVVPKLVTDDIPLLADVFPGVECSPVEKCGWKKYFVKFKNYIIVLWKNNGLKVLLEAFRTRRRQRCFIRH